MAQRLRWQESGRMAILEGHTRGIGPTRHHARLSLGSAGGSRAVIVSVCSVCREFDVDQGLASWQQSSALQYAGFVSSEVQLSFRFVDTLPAHSVGRDKRCDQTLHLNSEVCEMWSCACRHDLPRLSATPKAAPDGTVG